MAAYPVESCFRLFLFHCVLPRLELQFVGWMLCCITPSVSRPISVIVLTSDYRLLFLVVTSNGKASYASRGSDVGSMEKAEDDPNA